MTPSTTKAIREELSEIFPEVKLKQVPPSASEDAEELKLHVATLDTGEIKYISDILSRNNVRGLINRSGTGLSITFKD